VTCARILALRNALVLRNAPATAPEFNVLRTARDLTFEFAFALRVSLPFELTSVRWPPELLGSLWTVEARWPRALDPADLGPADERDIAGRALT
jgi:hypothetical protein